MEWTNVPVEVAALLQELDADPERAIEKLAAIPRKTRARKLQSSDERLAQELATAYRDVTSGLLGRYAQTAQFADPYWEGLLHRSVRKGVELRLTPFDRIRTRAAAARRGIAQLGVEAPHECEQLEELRAPRPTVSALQAALASWRLLRNDHAAIAAAWDYIRREEYESAETLLDEVVRMPTANVHRSIAWEARGALALRVGKPDKAALAFRESSEAEIDRPAPLFSWLVIASTLGASREAEEAARRIDEMVDESDPSLQYCVEAFEALRARRIFRGRVSDDLDRDKLSRGPASSKILHALP